MKAKPRAKVRLSPILEDPFPDPESCPIDSAAKVALSEDPHEYTWALYLLRNMYEFGREEAGVFLIGLLMTCGNNWEKRIAILGMLRQVRTEACVDVLFGELRRVKNTNSTRRYLSAVIDVLTDMPAKLVRSGFEALAEDTSFSHRMRAKFEQALDLLEYHEWRGQPPPPIRKRR